jgi:hypothetical protein
MDAFGESRTQNPDDFVQRDVSKAEARSVERASGSRSPQKDRSNRYWWKLGTVRRQLERARLELAPILCIPVRVGQESSAIPDRDRNCLDGAEVSVLDPEE